MRIRAITIAILICIPICGMGAALTKGVPGAAGEVPLISTRNNHFSIPFEIKVEKISDLPKEVELLHSNDAGTNWYSSGRVLPDKKQFLFQAPCDGEYWFLFKTYGRDGIAKKPARTKPMLRVLVDTVPPQLTLSAEQKSSGEVYLRWAVEDSNLDRKSPKIQISYYVPNQKSANVSRWKPIAVDPLTIRSEENKHFGDLIFWPENNASSVEIQAECVDAAGNREMQSRTLSLTPSKNPRDAMLFSDSANPRIGLAASDVSPSRLSPISSGQSANSTQFGKTENSRVPLTPPKPLTLASSEYWNSREKGVRNRKAGDESRPILTAAQLTESLKSSLQLASESRSGPNPLAKVPTQPKYADQVAAVPDFQSEVSDKVGTDRTDPEDENSVFVGPILLFEELEIPKEPALDPLSPPLLELPEDEDEVFPPPEPTLIQVNPKYAAPANPENSNESTPSSSEMFGDLSFLLDLEDYGNPAESSDRSDLSVDADSPASSQDPAPDSLPTPDTPFVKISKVSLIKGPKSSQVVVKWDSSDKTWTAEEDVNIHILRGISQTGPWKPIAQNLKNTGSHSWSITQEDRIPFFVLVLCERNENEIVSDTTLQLIQIPESLLSIQQ